MRKVILILLENHKYTYSDSDVGLDYTNPFYATKKEAVQAAVKKFGKNCSFAGESLTIYEAQKFKVKHAGDAFVWAYGN